MNLSACYERGTKKKKLNSRQDSHVWPPKHRAGALSTWVTENSWSARPCTRFTTQVRHCWPLQYTGHVSNMNQKPINGLKRVTRVHRSWIFTLITVFGIYFQQNCCRAITMRWWPDFCISRLRRKVESLLRRGSPRYESFFAVTTSRSRAVVSWFHNVTFGLGGKPISCSCSVSVIFPISTFESLLSCRKV